jgi:hypothetical protein
MSTVGVQDTSNRWNQAGCSLIWDSTGMKFAVMKRETSSSAYDSASSRAHPPQAGAALKSIRSGRSEFLASESAASTSVLFHGTGICVSSHRSIRVGRSTGCASRVVDGADERAEDLAQQQ